MTSSKVGITDYITDPRIESDLLGDAFSPDAGPDTEVLLVWHQRIDAPFLDRFPKLKAVIRYGVGYDNLDLDELSRRGIYACNTPDYGVDEVADTAIAMIMNMTRGVSRYDYLCRTYTRGWQEHVLRPLRRTSTMMLGVVGAGRIGGSVLLKASALGFRTVLYDPYRPPGHEKTLRAARTESLAGLLGQADIVSLNLNMTAESRGMVNAAFLAAMKPGSSLVNTARGALLDDLDTLYEPLRSGRLHSVALDVLPEEPPVHGGKLLDAWRRREEWLDGRLTINPHGAYYSQEAYEEMRRKTAANALRVLQGHEPLNILNGLGKGAVAS
ncbi:MAG: C-terminal binding protein [Lentisphaerota bacterium]